MGKGSGGAGRSSRGRTSKGAPAASSSSSSAGVTATRAAGRGTAERKARAEVLRAVAQVKRFERAFDKSPGARDNFVRLDHFRERLGGTRESQDRLIHTARSAGRFSLEAHEGLHGVATPSMNAAGIRVKGRDGENTSNLVYISRG